MHWKPVTAKRGLPSRTAPQVQPTTLHAHTQLHRSPTAELQGPHLERVGSEDTRPCGTLRELRNLRTTIRDLPPRAKRRNGRGEDLQRLRTPNEPTAQDRAEEKNRQHPTGICSSGYGKDSLKDTWSTMHKGAPSIVTRRFLLQGVAPDWILLFRIEFLGFGAHIGSLISGAPGEQDVITKTRFFFFKKTTRTEKKLDNVKQHSIQSRGTKT